MRSGFLRYLRMYGQLGRYTLAREMAFRGNFLVKVSVEVIWLGILMALSMNDYLVRGWMDVLGK